MSTVSWGRGIAGIGARNTEQDTPTQKPLADVAAPLMNMPAVGHIVSSGVDGGITSGLGGPIPEHSQHWADYFTGGAMWNSPRGNKAGAVIAPTAASVARSVADPQHHAGAGDGSGFLFLRTGAQKLSLGLQGR